MINLVSEDTIEHRMLALLEQKRALADAVLDRQGDPALVKMPNSRSAFLERLNQVLDHAPPAVPAEPEPIDMLRDDLVALHGAALHRILARDGEDGVLIVVSLPPERIAEEQDRLAERFDVPVSVIDQTTHEAMLRLAGAGFVAMPTEGLREVFPGPEAQTGNVADRRRMRADALVQRARRKFNAATLLEGGGFAEEALAPAVEAARFATGAIAALRGLGEPDDAESAAAFLARTEPDNGFENLPHGVIGILSGDHGDDGIAPVGSLIDQVDDALRQD